MIPVSVRAIAGSSWTKKLTCDMVPYYANAKTGELTWDTPEELRSSADRGRDAGEWAWLPDAAEGWVACRKTGGGYATEAGAPKKLGRGEAALPLSRVRRRLRDRGEGTPRAEGTRASKKKSPPRPDPAKALWAMR